MKTNSFVDLFFCVLAACVAALIWSLVLEISFMSVLRYTGVGFGGLWLAYQIEKVWFSAKIKN